MRLGKRSPERLLRWIRRLPMPVVRGLQPQFDRSYRHAGEIARNHGEL